MHVSDILKHKGGRIVSVPPTEKIEAAAAWMRTERIGAILVIEPGGRLRGIFSEKDFVRALCDRGPLALGLPVTEFMHPEPPTCHPTDTVAAVARQMTEGRARHMPVTDQGRVVGVISIGDIVNARLEEMELESATLRDLARSKSMAG